MKISTTEELLAVLPHQLGHRPEQCVAIIMVTDRVLGPVARIDIPPEKDVGPTAEHLLESLGRVRPQAAMLVGHDTVPGESRSLLRALHKGMVAAGIGIIDHVVVRDGRWWGWCCRPGDELDGLLAEHVDGHPLPDEATVPAVAEFIARGSAPLASRDELGALVAEDPAVSHGVGDALANLGERFDDEIDAEGVLPCGTRDDEERGGACRSECDCCDSWGDDDDEGEEERAAREAALDEALSRIRARIRELDRVPDLWAQVLAPVGERGDTFAVSDDEVARLAHSLVDKEWRDSLVAWMSPVMFPLDLVDDASRALLGEHVPAGPTTTSEQSEVVLRRVLHVATRIPDEFALEAAAMCTVAGCVAWGVGNGATAGDAAERALRVHPGYTLAGYLSQMVHHQMRPRHPWSEVAA
ncbi:hypothetical protein GCM10022415_29470 [Knoellia locipacati]|uniref:DUF4192 domain-containing protein n=1 Tax=Knoellia locipacati TaxID=882824 RepID=A0A512T4N8_9MICO|nr:hypothetical protein KLO01_32330 [Knoellia locipacati]